MAEKSPLTRTNPGLSCYLETLDSCPGITPVKFEARAPMRLDLTRSPTLSSPVATRWPSCRALRMEENGVDADFPWRCGTLGFGFGFGFGLVFGFGFGFSLGLGLGFRLGLG